MVKRQQDSRTFALILIVILVLILIKNNEPTLYAVVPFGDPINNTLFNPDIELWTNNFPDGWASGWDADPGPSSNTLLIQETGNVRSGSYSAAFIDKGYNNRSGVEIGSCKDWCVWYTSSAKVYPHSLVNARFYYDPVYFTRYDDTRTSGVRTYIHFYNKDGNKILSRRGDILDDKELGDGSVGWTPHVIKAVAPSEATDARISIEMATRGYQPHWYLTSFYVDDFWLESLRCDEKWVCDDWSYCQAGYQFKKCVDLNGCDLFFKKPQDSRICTGSLDDHIKAYKEKKISMVRLMNEIDTYRDSYITDEEYEDMFRRISYKPFDGTKNRTWHISEPNYGWEDSIAIVSYLNMYEITGDAFYIDIAAERVEDHVNDYPYEGIMWGERYNISYKVLPTSGNLMYAWMKFVWAVKRDGLVRHDSVADQALDLGLTNYLEKWENEFQEWEKDGHEMGCIVEYIRDNGEFNCGPWNAIGQASNAFIYASKILGNERYMDIARRNAAFWKYMGMKQFDNVNGPGKYYAWGYKGGFGVPNSDWPDSIDDIVNDGVHWGSIEVGHREGSNYLVYDIPAIYEYYKNGLVFTEDDLRIIANGVVYNMWNEDIFDPYISSHIKEFLPTDGDYHDAEFTDQSIGFAYLGQFNPILELIMQRIQLKVFENTIPPAGNYGSTVYDCIRTDEFGIVCDDRGYIATSAYQLQGISEILMSRKDKEERGIIV